MPTSLGMAGHRKKVNEFMIDQKIPVKWRNHVPLLVASNRILWVCGYRCDERARIRAHTKQVLSLRFEPL
jgi:tRNA(Ile)-lysidine synthase